jgi:hypothetical protein
VIGTAAPVLMVDRIGVAALQRTIGDESVRVCVVVRLLASRLGPELRVCGSYSAKYDPPYPLVSALIRVYLVL